MFSIQEDDQQFSRYIEDSINLTNTNSKENYLSNKKKFVPSSLISYDKIQFGEKN